MLTQLSVKGVSNMHKNHNKIAKLTDLKSTTKP